MDPMPMLTCQSVSASSEWYQRVLGFESAHGGDEYEILSSNGRVVMQLHEIDTDEHPALFDPSAPVGNGVAAWFETDDYDGALARIRAVTANEGNDTIAVDIAEDDHVNPLAKHREIWLRDLDGYLVVISGRFGTAEG